MVGLLYATQSTTSSHVVQCLPYETHVNVSLVKMMGFINSAAGTPSQLLPRGTPKLIKTQPSRANARSDADQGATLPHTVAYLHLQYSHSSQAITTCSTVRPSRFQWQAPMPSPMRAGSEATSYASRSQPAASSSS